MISCSKAIGGFYPAVFAVVIALYTLTATACLSGHAEGSTRTLTGHGGEVLTVAFAPDGPYWLLGVVTRLFGCGIR